MAIAAFVAAVLASGPSAASRPGGDSAPINDAPADDEWGAEDDHSDRDGEWEGDEDWGDSDLDDITIDEDSLELAPPRVLSLTGFFRSSWGLWSERLDAIGSGDFRNSWARGRQSLDLVLSGKQEFLRFVLAGHFEYDLRYLGDERGLTDDFDSATVAAHAWQLLPREAFLGFEWEHFDLIIGYQIVPWGQGEFVSVLDIVNPRDLREPGLVELDDIRTSVLATRLSYFVDDIRVEAIIVHEASFGFRAPPFGPFGQVPALLSAMNTPGPLVQAFYDKEVRFADAEPRFAFDQQQLLLRWFYTGPGIDLGIYAASVMDQRGIIELPQPAVLVDPKATRVDLLTAHPVYTALGTSGAWVSGSLLFEWEVAAKIRRSFNVVDFTGRPGAVEANAIDVMAGITYTPSGDGTLALELAKSTFTKKPPGLVMPVDLPVGVARADYRFLSQRLQFVGTATMFGMTSLDELAFIVGAEVNYEVSESWHVGGGYVHYRPSRDFGPVSGFTSHDQAFLDLRWDFTMLSIP